MYLFSNPRVGTEFLAATSFAAPTTSDSGELFEREGGLGPCGCRNICYFILGSGTICEWVYDPNPDCNKHSCNNNCGAVAGSS